MTPCQGSSGGRSWTPVTRSRTKRRISERHNLTSLYTRQFVTTYGFLSAIVCRTIFIVDVHLTVQKNSSTNLRRRQYQTVLTNILQFIQARCSHLAHKIPPRNGNSTSATSPRQGVIYVRLKNNRCDAIDASRIEIDTKSGKTQWRLPAHGIFYARQSW